MTSLLVTPCCCVPPEPIEPCPVFSDCDELDSLCGFSSITLEVFASGTVTTNLATYDWTLAPRTDSPGDVCIVETRLIQSTCRWVYSPTFTGRFDLTFNGSGPLGGQTFLVTPDAFDTAYRCLQEQPDIPRRSALIIRWERSGFSNTGVSVNAEGPYDPCPGASPLPDVSGGIIVDEGSISNPEFSLSSTIDTFSVVWT